MKPVIVVAGAATGAAGAIGLALMAVGTNIGALPYEACPERSAMTTTAVRPSCRAMLSAPALSTARKCPDAKQVARQDAQGDLAKQKKAAALLALERVTSKPQKPVPNVVARKPSRP